MEVPKNISFHSELRSLLLNELDRTAVTPMKEVLMQTIKKAVGEGFIPSFHVANTRSKSAFFRFLEMAEMNMIRKGTPDTVLIKSFDRLSYSDSFMDVLVEKIHRYPALTLNPWTV